MRYSILLGCLLALSASNALIAKPTKDRKKPQSERLCDYAQFGFRLGAARTNAIMKMPKEKKFKISEDKSMSFDTGSNYGFSGSLYGEYLLYEYGNGSFLDFLSPGDISGSIELSYAPSGFYMFLDNDGKSACERMFEVALLVKTYPAGFGKRYCFYGGLQFGKQLSAEYKELKKKRSGENTELEEKDFEDNKKEAIEKSYTKWNIGVVSGSEGIWDFDSFRLKIGARYFQGAISRLNESYLADAPSRTSFKFNKETHECGKIYDSRSEAYIAFDFSKLAG